MKIKELPLVLFTILGQAAVGVTVLSTALLLNGDPPLIITSVWVPLTSMVLLVLAFTAAIFHMGHPLGSVRTLTNLRSSWLSREILLFGLYKLFLLAVLLQRLYGGGFVWISIGASIAGMAALLASAMIYVSPGFPAMNNPVPVLYFLSTASIMGPCILMVISGEADLFSILSPYLAAALIGGGLMHLLIPSFWLSGGPVLRRTAKLHYGSFIFWIRMTIGFVIPIALMITHNKLPLSGIMLIAAGELLGRIIFFNRMTHASDHIGRLC